MAWERSFNCAAQYRATGELDEKYDLFKTIYGAMQ